MLIIFRMLFISFLITVLSFAQGLNIYKTGKQTFYVHRELPSVIIEFNNTDEVLYTSNNTYMFYPKAYTFNAESSKLLNLSNLRIGFEVQLGGSTIEGVITNEDVIGEGMNNKFSFVFNISNLVLTTFIIFKNSVIKSL